MILIFTTVLAQTEEEIRAATVPPITFVVTGILAFAIILLGIDLVRRVRRAHYREEIQQSLEAEIAERQIRDAGSAGAGDSGPAESPSSDDDRA